MLSNHLALAFYFSPLPSPTPPNSFRRHQKIHFATIKKSILPPSSSSLNHPVFLRLCSQLQYPLRLPTKLLPDSAQMVSPLWNPTGSMCETCTKYGTCGEEWARDPGAWSSAHRPVVGKHPTILQSKLKRKTLWVKKSLSIWGKRWLDSDGEGSIEEPFCPGPIVHYCCMCQGTARILAVLSSSCNRPQAPERHGLCLQHLWIPHTQGAWNLMEPKFVAPNSNLNRPLPTHCQVSFHSSFMLTSDYVAFLY